MIWGERHNSTIQALPKSGGSLTTLATDGTPNAIAADATAVYFTTSDGNVIKLVL